MTEQEIRPSDNDINAILKLTPQNIAFTYNTDGTINKIQINTQDIAGNPKTIKITFTYDSNGNITNINKEVT